MPVRQRPEFGEHIGIDLAAPFAHASEQPLSRSAEGSVLPTGVLLSWTALPPLQDPLQRIIYDPPPLAQLGYALI